MLLTASVQTLLITSVCVYVFLFYFFVYVCCASDRTVVDTIDFAHSLPREPIEACYFVDFFLYGLSEITSRQQPLPPSEAKY